MKYFKSTKSPRKSKKDWSGWTHGALFIKNRKFHMTQNIWSVKNGGPETFPLDGTMVMSLTDMKVWNKYPYKLKEITKKEYEEESFIAAL